MALAAGDNCFRITVSDDGQGIVPEDMERIFNTFYQSGNSKGGTGIGLPLARLLAIKHGGSVVCANGERGGLCSPWRFRSIPRLSRPARRTARIPERMAEGCATPLPSPPKRREPARY